MGTSEWGMILYSYNVNNYFTNKRYRKPRGNEKKDNPEKQDEEKKTKNTTHYVFDTIMHKQPQIT